MSNDVKKSNKLLFPKFPRVLWNVGFDGIHPAVYRLTGCTGTDADTHNEQGQIDLCQELYPDLPVDRRQAWEWLSGQDRQVHFFFCPRD